MAARNSKGVCDKGADAGGRLMCMHCALTATVWFGGNWGLCSPFKISEGCTAGRGLYGLQEQAGKCWEKGVPVQVVCYSVWLYCD